MGLTDHSINFLEHQLPDDLPHAHELPVNTVDDCLEVIPLSGILPLQQFEQSDQPLSIDVRGHLLVRDFQGNDEPEEDLIDDLKVGPRLLQLGFILELEQLHQLVLSILLPEFALG